MRLIRQIRKTGSGLSDYDLFLGLGVSTDIGSGGEDPGGGVNVYEGKPVYILGDSYMMGHNPASSNGSPPLTPWPNILANGSSSLAPDFQSLDMGTLSNIAVSGSVAHVEYLAGEMTGRNLDSSSVLQKQVRDLCIRTTYFADDTARAAFNGFFFIGAGGNDYNQYNPTDVGYFMHALYSGTVAESAAWMKANYGPANVSTDRNRGLDAAATNVPSIVKNATMVIETFDFSVSWCSAYAVAMALHALTYKFPNAKIVVINQHNNEALKAEIADEVGGSEYIFPSAIGTSEWETMLGEVVSMFSNARFVGMSQSLINAGWTWTKGQTANDGIYLKLGADHIHPTQDSLVEMAALAKPLFLNLSWGE
jgi:hypothetical protein